MELKDRLAGACQPTMAMFQSGIPVNMRLAATRVKNDLDKALDNAVAVGDIEAYTVHTHMHQESLWALGIVWQHGSPQLAAMEFRPGGEPKPEKD